MSFLQWYMSHYAQHVWFLRKFQAKGPMHLKSVPPTAVSDQKCSADSSYQIKSVPPTAVFRQHSVPPTAVFKRMGLNLICVQIPSLRSIFSKNWQATHSGTYTIEKRSFRTFIWASVSKRVYFPFNIWIVMRNGRSVDFCRCSITPHDQQSQIPNEL